MRREYMDYVIIFIEHLSKHLKLKIAYVQKYP
jgi:hypothetical protein